MSIIIKLLLMPIVIAIKASFRKVVVFVQYDESMLSLFVILLAAWVSFANASFPLTVIAGDGYEYVSGGGGPAVAAEVGSIGYFWLRNQK